MALQKKISFSFSKPSRAASNTLISKKFEEKDDIELIECLEGQSIKVKNAAEVVKQPLIIPLRDDAKTLLDRVRQSRQIKNNENNVDQRPDSELTLDELAARQLVQEATQEFTTNSEKKIHSVPIATEIPPNQDGKEPTLDDYDNVPIDDYGVAMLRGMGWAESSGIGKNNECVTKMIEPELRPKGMGLGANKLVNSKKQELTSSKVEDLSIIKGGFAKIIAGKHIGNYCQIMSFDDESGRIIVKTSLDQSVLSLNEFLLSAVTKEEYTKNGKVLNNAKFEEYHKKKSNNGEVEHKLHKDVYTPSTSRESHRNKTTRGRDILSSDEDNDTRNGRVRKHKDSKDRSRDKKHKSKTHKKHRKRERSRSHEKEYKKQRERSRHRSRSRTSSSEDRKSSKYKKKRS